jgi:hypothetical protein
MVGLFRFCADIIQARIVKHCQRVADEVDLMVRYPYENVTIWKYMEEEFLIWLHYTYQLRPKAQTGFPISAGAAILAQIDQLSFHCFRIRLLAPASMLLLNAGNIQSSGSKVFV